MILYIVYIFLIILILYLFSIMPKIFNTPDFKDFEGIYYAHRGLHGSKSIAPENSLKAFQLAVEEGYGIELDIQLTKDNIPVVFHDESLDRVCGVSKILKECSYEELQDFTLYDSKEKIPTFIEVLDLVDGQVPLIVEFKDESKDMLICNIVSDYLDSYKGVYCIESFNPLIVLWYKRNRKDVVRGQLSTHHTRKNKTFKTIVRNFILEYLLLNFLTKPDFIAYNHKYKDNLSFVLCKKLFKTKTVAYTIKSNKELAFNKDDFDLFIFDNFIPKN